MNNVIPLPKQEDVSKNDEFKEVLCELRRAIAAFLKASGHANDPRVQKLIREAEEG